MEGLPLSEQRIREGFMEEEREMGRSWGHRGLGYENIREKKNDVLGHFTFWENIILGKNNVDNTTLLNGLPSSLINQLYMHFEIYY